MGNLQRLSCLLALFCFLQFTDGNGTVETSHLKIKVSLRNLDKGILHTDDPYYIVYLSEDGGKTKTEIGQSEVIKHNLIPDWEYEFEMTFDRNKNQYLYFHVIDDHCIEMDDTLGRVWMNVADYVDKGEYANLNLDKDGSLIVRTTKEGQAGSGRLPLPPAPEAASVEGEPLRFQLSARGLPTKDDFLFIKRSGDPYVLVESIDTLGSKTFKKVGRTNTILDTRNPVWNDVITFNWNRNKDQRIRFSLYDEDFIKNYRFDRVWMEVNDYVAKGQNYTLLLPKQGKLIVTKAK